MTQFLNKSFSVGMAGDQNYRDNWDRVFAKKKCGRYQIGLGVCQNPADDDHECPDEGNVCNCCEQCTNECANDK